jgi:hypothetical protein
MYLRPTFFCATPAATLKFSDSDPVDISGDLMNINTMDYPVALICQEKVFNKI